MNLIQKASHRQFHDPLSIMMLKRETVGN